MRAKLKKDNRNVVFVWGFASGVTGHNVKIYNYDGMSKSSGQIFDIRFSRRYWNVLIRNGYHVVPSKVPQPTPLECQG